MASGESATPDEWRRYVMLFELTGNIDPANIYATSIDVVNITNGGIDSSWTDTDHTAVATQLHTFIGTVLGPNMPSEVRHKRTDVYRMAFADIVPDPPPPERPANPFLKSGPPVATFPSAGGGTGTSQMMPPQVAWTTTDRTAYPRHWGRNYWPIPHPSLIVGTGHLSSASVDAVGGGLHACYDALQAQEYYPVVPVTRIEKQPGRGLLTVTSVQMDNTPDIVRRRRPKDPTHYYRSPEASTQPLWQPWLEDKSSALADSSSEPSAGQE